MKRSADAMIGPPRVLTQPVGSDEVMCSANAPVTGDGVPSARGGTSSRPSSSMNRAPWWPSSPGWNMNSTRPGISSRRADSSRAAPASIATCVSCPQACIVPSLRELKSSPVSSGIGSASMSPRSSTVGPGLPPVSRAAIPLVVSCSSTSSGKPVDRLEHVLPGDRQVVADLRPLVELPPQPHRLVVEVLGFLAQRLDRHGRMVGLFRARGTGRTKTADWSTSSTRTTGSSRSDALADARRELRHRAVAIAVIDRRPAAGPPAQRRQGRLARDVGHRRRRRRRRVARRTRQAAERELAEELGIDGAALRADRSRALRRRRRAR